MYIYIYIYICIYIFFDQNDQPILLFTVAFFDDSVFKLNFPFLT